jgi:hypothetical protein
MTNIVNFTDLAKAAAKAPKTTTTPQPTTGGYSFQAEVQSDIVKLCESLGIDEEQAIHIATDFYRKYPALMEWVRSPDHLLRGK